MRFFYWKISYEGMTTIPFTRKNNLLSLLRGYDLPIKRNYLNAALLGYGKKHHITDEEKEERYQKFRSIAYDSLKKYFKVIRDLISDEDFWHSSGFYEVLSAFTRFYVADLSKTSSDFLENLEAFQSEIAQSVRYNKLLGAMNNLANKLIKDRRLTPAEYKKLEEKYEEIKEKSKNGIKQFFYRVKFQKPDVQVTENLILDCIVYSTETPEEFALNWERYKNAVAMKSDNDILKIFSEDLQDTAADDDEESEGEYDSDDLDFVVSDEEPIAKRRRLTRPEGSDDENSDDEGEVNGSGFYDWWW